MATVKLSFQSVSSFISHILSTSTGKSLKMGAQHSKYCPKVKMEQCAYTVNLDVEKIFTKEHNRGAYMHHCMMALRRPYMYYVLHEIRLGVFDTGNSGMI